MSIKVGFVLLTHDKPYQAIRLVNRLNFMFDYPPISWHHDFSNCQFPTDAITDNISIVRPHFKTEWAKFSVVEAMLAALTRLLESKNSPDWFILLSGADYPIKAAATIVRDLSASRYDAHIHYNRISIPGDQGKRSYLAGRDRTSDWQMDVPGVDIAKCRRRYCCLKLRIPFINRRLRFTVRNMRLDHPSIVAPFLPFTEDLSCFAGEHWFSANRTAGEYLIQFHRTRPALANHYRSLDEYTIVPEESYYQTIFCNAGALKVSCNHWRYVDWSESKSSGHPKLLSIEDLPRLYESPAHFARKFDADVDSKVLDALDRI